MTKRKVEIQTDLPGMEDRPLKDLESAAREYAHIRDERVVGQFKNGHPRN